MTTPPATVLLPHQPATASGPKVGAVRDHRDARDFTCCENDSGTARAGRIGMWLCRWFPIAFVYGLAVFVIYFFGVSICIDYLLYGEDPRTTQGAIYIAVFWPALVMVLYCFTRAAFTSPGSPSEYNIKIASTREEEQAALAPDQYLAITDRHKQVILPRASARICGLCNTPKPARCHHCSACKQCFLKMDHHCVWLNACVGYQNYKYFFCLLTWGWLFCGFIFGATLQVLIRQLADDQLEGVSVVYLILDFLAFALCLSTLMLFVYHSYLIGKGMTTIEHLEYQEERDDLRRRARYQARYGNGPPVSSLPSLEPDVFSYSEGSAWRNACSVLGPNPLLWIIPYRNTLGNGMRFPREDCNMRPRSTPPV